MRFVTRTKGASHQEVSDRRQEEEGPDKPGQAQASEQMHLARGRSRRAGHVVGIDGKGEGVGKRNDGDRRHEVQQRRRKIEVAKSSE